MDWLHTIRLHKSSTLSASPASVPKTLHAPGKKKGGRSRPPFPRQRTSARSLSSQ
jgi:hypothetical protein